MHYESYLYNFYLFIYELMLLYFSKEIWPRNINPGHEYKINGTLSSDRLIDGRNKC